MKSCPKICLRRSGIHAFSTLELLIVALIVAVLSVLAIPAFMTIRASNTSIRCVNHLRATGAALHSYVSERGSVFKSFARGNTAEVSIWGLQLYSKGYLSDKSITRCPAGKSLRPLSDNAWYWNTYGFNMAAANGTPTPPGTADGLTFVLRFAAVDNFARRPMLVDSATATEFEPGARSETFRVNILKVSDGIQLRHKNKANVLFMDGHVEALSREEAQEYFNPLYIYDANQRL